MRPPEAQLSLLRCSAEKTLRRFEPTSNIKCNTNDNIDNYLCKQPSAFHAEASNAAEVALMQTLLSTAYPPTLESYYVQRRA